MSDLLLTIVGNSNSSIAIGKANAFIGQSGQFVINNNAPSQFIDHMVNGVNVGGTITINMRDVAATAAATKISVDQALLQVTVHELGHFNYATADAHRMASTPAAREAWCYQREGESSYFSYTVAEQARANGVAMQVSGVTRLPDLYATLNSYKLGLSIDPRSNAFGDAMVQQASSYFSTDPKYQAFCRAWANGTATQGPSYMPPDMGGDGNVGGGGGGGGGGGSGGGGGIIGGGGDGDGGDDGDDRNEMLVFQPSHSPELARGAPEPGLTTYAAAQALENWLAAAPQSASGPVPAAAGVAPELVLVGQPHGLHADMLTLAS